jgi:DNA-binding transcriptional ArsR family regulator
MLTIWAAPAYRVGVALDQVFDALANQSRREIVARLSRGPVTTPEIGRQFGFSKQALSRHLSLLEDAGLIQRLARGRVHELSLVPVPLGEVAGWLADIRRGWETNLDRLDAVLRSSGD